MNECAPINTSNGRFPCSMFSPVINLSTASACFFLFSLRLSRFSLSTFLSVEVADSELPLDMNVWVNAVYMPLKMTQRPV